MSGSFDPYHIWLGISRKDQPPNHYRLLGVDLFESNPDAIESAADRQMSHVRTFQTGRHSAESQKLLNEIAAAKVCLLSSEKKAAYDQRLRQKLQAEAEAKIQSLPNTQPVGSPEETSAPREAIRHIAVSASRHTPGRKKVPWQVPVLAVSLVVAGVLAYAVWSHRGPPTPPQPSTALEFVWPESARKGATLEIDGRRVPVPPTGPVRFACQRGKFHIVAGRPGYKPVELTVTVKPGQHEPVPLHWVPLNAVLVFDWPEDQRQGATLRIDDKPVPLLPEVRYPVEPGSHNYVATRRGFETIRGTATVEAGEERTVKLDWQRVPLPRPDTPPQGVDLLAIVKPKRDTFEGQWRFEGQALVSSGDGISRLQIPCQPPDQYDLVLTARRVSGRGDLNLGIVVGGRQCLAVLDGWPHEGHLSGLHVLDGRGLELHQDGPHQQVRRGQVIPNGSQVTIVCEVRKFGRDYGVRVVCNHREIFSWKGSSKRLSLEKHWLPPNNRELFLSAARTAFHITRMRLIPIPADTPARPEPEPQPESEPEPPKRLPAAAVADPQWPISGRKVEQRLREEIFPKQYAAAKEPDGKLALAKLLLTRADKTNDDPTARYVMLTQARDLAADAGAAVVAMGAVERLAAEYEVDAWSLRLTTLQQLERAARTSEARHALASSALELADRAFSQDHYEVAEKMAKVAVSAAAKVRGAALGTRARERRDRARALLKAWEAFRPAFEALASKPNDPEANLAAGRYLCFVKEDWQQGLPHLAKGSDAAVKAVAEADLKQPSDPLEQLKLGDQWWDLAGSAASDDRNSLRSRASYWYQRAEPKLTGLKKAHMEKRLRASGRLVDLLNLIKRKRIFRVGNWQFDGKILLSPPKERSARLQLPYMPPDEYQLIIDVERMPNYRRGGGILGEGALVLGLSQAGRQFLAAVDFDDGGRGYYKLYNLLMLYDGKIDLGNPTRKVTTASLLPGHPSTVVCTVRKTGVTVMVNGQVELDWTGDFNRLSMDPQWEAPNPRRLFIGSQACSFRITKLEVRPLEGD